MTSPVAQTAADRVIRAAGPANGVPCVLLMFGELALKGRKRSSFAVALERNLRRALRGAAGSIDLERRGSSFLAVAPPDGLARALEVATDVPGLSVVEPALRLEPSTEHAARAAVELVRPLPVRSFAVRSRRRDKNFPVTSMDVARLVGAAVKAELGLAVDLRRPELELHVEAYEHELFVSVDRLRGAGGLPVGTSGRALVLLS